MILVGYTWNVVRTLLFGYVGHFGRTSVRICISTVTPAGPLLELINDLRISL